MIWDLNLPIQQCIVRSLLFFFWGGGGGGVYSGTRNTIFLCNIVNVFLVYAFYSSHKKGLYCSFSFFGRFFVPIQNFSLIWRRYHNRRSTTNFDLCSTLITIERLVLLTTSVCPHQGSNPKTPHAKRTLDFYKRGGDIGSQKPLYFLSPNDTVC